MDAISCIKTRRSVRKYTEEMVPHDQIEQVIEAARFAPSWKNTQTARYVVVEDAAVIARICAEGLMDFALNQKTVGRAKQLVVVSYVKNRSGYEKDGSYSTTKGAGWEMFDAGIAAQTFSLAAHAYGIGSVIMGIFDEEKIAGILELPDDQQVACVMAIGYPAFAPDAPPRKETTEILTYR